MGIKKTTTNKSAAKRKNTLAAAESAVETVAVSAPVQQERRRRISFEKISTKPQIPSNTASAATVAARRVAAGGIIESKKRRRGDDDEDDDEDAGAEEKDDKKWSDAEEAEELDELSSDDDDDKLSDNLSDDDDDDNASEEASWENPFEKSKREGTRLSYPALRLRFLPVEFQEPQLFKFLSQFGARVLNCFCVRSRRTHQSKGIAYVQFDTENILGTVVEECHGMSLGGRALQAHRVTLHRAMPSKEKVMRRRRLAYAYKTRGAPLRRHDMRRKSPIAALIKYTQSEKENNAHLQRLGIDYACHEFEEQLAKVPRELILSKKQLRMQSNGGQKSKEGNNAHKKPNVETVDSIKTPKKAATATKQSKKVKLAPVKSAPGSLRRPTRKAK